MNNFFFLPIPDLEELTGGVFGVAEFEFHSPRAPGGAKNHWEGGVVGRSGPMDLGSYGSILIPINP